MPYSRLPKIRATTNTQRNHGFLNARLVLPVLEIFAHSKAIRVHAHIFETTERRFSHILTPILFIFTFFRPMQQQI